MEILLQRDLGSSMLSIAVILGWLGLFFVFLRVLTILIKRILEGISKNRNYLNKSINLNLSHKPFITKYNNLKMSILDKVKIGNSVQINLELSKDRLTKETIDAINVSSLGKIINFKITDGKGIGVVLQLSNGKEQWFFEDEIDLLDENGNIIKKNNKKENSNFIFDFLRGLNYENKNKVTELLNPINFFIWLVVSFKDIF